MLAANVCAARFLQEKLGEQAIFRNHQGPDSEGVATMRKFLSGLGLSMGGGGSPSAADYRNLLDKVENRPDISSVVQTVLLRSLSQAVYSPEQLGHFALAFSVYTHFTSPIRRYSDLVVHRLIKSLIGLESYAQPGPAGRSPGEIGERCSFTERRADEAAYDVLGWLKAEFMSDKIGESFAGVISGVREFGVFVQLQDIFVDGLIHVTNLGNDYYQFDAVYHKLQGERSGKVYRLGDKVEVVVAGVNLQESKIDFELASLPADQSRRTPGKKQNRARKSRSRKRR
jgi:ribonuclease R